ncbi:MAG: hypothetical protein IJJ33_00200 [Victivallales bacterium]|nr:hypothetical protein [Victivallales bacterium]
MNKVLFLLFVACSLFGAGFHADLSRDLAGQKEGGGQIEACAPGGDVSFVKGRVPGGSAACLSDECSLCYPLAPAWFNVNRGQLSFWISPLDWGNGVKRPAQETFLPLVAVDADKGENWTYVACLKAEPQGSLKLQVQARCKNVSDMRYFQARIPESALKKGQWSQFVLSWSNMELCAFVNGEPLGRLDLGLPVEKEFAPAWKLWIVPRDFWHGRRNGQYLLSELILTDHLSSPAEVRQNYLAARAAEKATANLQAPVPRASVAVKLDGNVDEDEWADATILPVGVTHGDGNFNSALAGVLYLKHDGRNLYYALRVATLERAPIPAKAGANDMGIFSANGAVADFWWQRSDGTDCQFGLAPNGAWALRIDREWKTDCPVRHAESNAEQGWCVECAVPMEPLGMSGTGQHKMNFCFVRPEYMKSFENRWLCLNLPTPRRSLSANFADLDFRQDGTAVRLAVCPTLNIGRVSFTVSASRKTSWAFHSDVPMSVPLQLSSEPLECIAEAPIGSHTMEFSVPNVWHCEYKYAVAYPVDLEACVHASARTLEYSVDARGLDQVATGTFVMRLLDSAGRELAGLQGALKSGMAKGLLPLDDLKPGKYVLEAVVTGGQGVFRKTLELQRPDDVFLHDRKGLERTVCWPYTPLRTTAGSIETAFHKYSFSDDSPFPMQADSNGRDLLNAPCSLHLMAGGKKVTWINTDLRIEENAPDRHVASGVLRAQGLPVRIEWTRRTDYDGMLKYRLLLIAEQEVRIDRFHLETTVRPEFSRFCLAPNFSAEWQKEGKCHAFPSIWLSGRDAGWTFFSDTDLNWIFTQEPLRASRTREGDAVMSARFIDEPTMVSGEVPYTIAMMATPAKPPRPDWRSIHSEGWGRLRGQNLQILMGIRDIPRFRRGDDFSQPLADNIRKWDKMFRERPAHLTRYLPYLALNALSDNTPVGDWYGPDWERRVDGVQQAKSYHGTDHSDGQKFSLIAYHIDYNKKGPADFICYYLDKILAEFPFGGLYTDGGDVYRCDTPYHGGALSPALPMKKPPRNWEMFGTRDVFERFYRIIRARRGEAGLMFNHSWDCYYPALLSFHDLVFPGEEFMHSIARGMHVYIEETPLEKWQSNYQSELLGAGVQFLGQWRFLGGDLITLPEEQRWSLTQPLLMACLLHDVPLSGANYPQVSPTWEVLDKAKACDARFTGYWQPGALAVDNPHVKVSFYQWKGQEERLAVVGNLTRTEQIVHLPAQHEYRDAYDQSALPETLAIPGNFGFRLVWMK